MISICSVLFMVVMLALKLSGSDVSWWIVFAPMVIALICDLFLNLFASGTFGLESFFGFFAARSKLQKMYAENDELFKDAQ